MPINMLDYQVYSTPWKKPYTFCECQECTYYNIYEITYTVNL